jgi:hypothetical protein
MHQYTITTILWILLILVACFQTSLLTPAGIRLAIRTKRIFILNSIEDKIDQLRICISRKTVGYSPSELTMRPLEDYVRYQAPFFSFFHTLDVAKQGSVLEVGCGSGRALLDLKAEYPSIKAYGTNLKGYGFAQGNGSPAAFWSVANHFDTPVYCDQHGSPSFPVILETHPIQSPKFTTLFQPETFDFIFSRHSLNQGKLAANESHIFIPRLLPLLKVGSPAMIHMLGGTFHSTSDNKYYLILKVWNIVSKDAAQRRVSVVLYQTLCYASKFCISVVFKKCAPGAALHGTYKDCIVPPSINHRLPPPDWLVPELARVARLAKDGKMSLQEMAFGDNSTFRYAHEYMATFVKALDRWEQQGTIAAAH